MTTTFGSSGFKKLTLESSQMINHNVKQMVFRLPNGNEQAGIQTISGILPVVRPYTPLQIDEQGQITFLVKKYPSGKGSGKLHSMQPGDVLTVRAIHEFEYKPNQFSNLTILAGGAGITPFIQLVRSVMSDSTDKTKISMVYSNTAEEDILLGSELDKYSSEKPDSFRIKYVISNPSSDTSSDYARGHMSKEIIEQALPPKAEWSKSKVLVCGPPPMMNAVAGAKSFGGFGQGSLGGILKALGLTSSQVQKF